MKFEITEDTIRKIFWMLVTESNALVFSSFYSHAIPYPAEQIDKKAAMKTIQGIPSEPIPADKSIFTDTMAELTWPEVKQESKQGAVVVFPIAVVEEHGPHIAVILKNISMQKTSIPSSRPLFTGKSTTTSRNSRAPLLSNRPSSKHF